MRNHAPVSACVDMAGPHCAFSPADHAPPPDIEPKPRRSSRRLRLFCGGAAVCLAIAFGAGMSDARWTREPARPALKIASVLSDRPLPPRRPPPILIDERLVDFAPLATTTAGETPFRSEADFTLADDRVTEPSEPETSGPDVSDKTSDGERDVPVQTTAAENAPAVTQQAQAAPSRPEAAPAKIDAATAETIRVARERAEERRRIGDIFGMRLFLERAARLGSREALLRLAQSYDERYLAAWGVRGVRPDPALAEALYEEASDAAALHAKAELERREHQ